MLKKDVLFDAYDRIQSIIGGEFWPKLIKNSDLYGLELVYGCRRDMIMGSWESSGLFDVSFGGQVPMAN